MADHSIKGKTALIAGGGKNLGGLIARDLAAHGAKAVAVHYNSAATKAAADATVADVTAAATWYIAETYLAFSTALLESERPAGLSEAERAEYELVIEEEAFMYEAPSNGHASGETLDPTQRPAGSASAGSQRAACARSLAREQPKCRRRGLVRLLLPRALG